MARQRGRTSDGLSMADGTGNAQSGQYRRGYCLVRHDRRDGQLMHGTTDGTNTRRTQYDRRDGKGTISTNIAESTVLVRHDRRDGHMISDGDKMVFDTSGRHIYHYA